MKTKEEILNAELTTVNMDSAIEITCASLRAMQLYSDQQNKELREERPFRFSPTNSEREWQVKIVNDYIHPNQEGWQKMNAACNALIENDQLRKENEELKKKAMMSIAHEGEIENKLTRLRELLDETLKWLQRSYGECNQGRR